MTCTHFGDCGGCSLPGVAYGEQLARKQSRLAALLGEAVPPLVPSPSETHFRSKVAFVFGPAAHGRGLVMGHYARGSQRVVPIHECPVHAERGNRIAFALRDRLARAGVTAAGPSLAGVLRHLIVRTTRDEREAVAMLVVTRNDKALRTPVKGLLASVDRPDGFFLNVHDRPGPLMVGRETIRIAGKSHVRDGIVIGTGRGDPGRETVTADGTESPEPTVQSPEPKAQSLSFLVSPTAFFQTNVGAAELLVRLVMEGVGPGAGRVLDLYCGSGLFSVPLAAAGAIVTAVEENRQATADLQANLRVNQIDERRARVITSRAEDALPRVARDAWDAVVLDPPREGCAPAVMAAVFERMRPPRVVYVSCNPEALAADLPGIRGAGYRLARAQAVDMFPHTDHIETVAVFERS